MRILLDTNIFLFMILDPQLLNHNSLTLINDPENILMISTESIKEAIHLFKSKKISPKWTKASDIFNYIDNLGIKISIIKKEHLLTYANLEYYKDHNDPSDQIIIAQAITEKLTLISSDSKFKFYVKNKLSFIFNQK